MRAPGTQGHGEHLGTPPSAIIETTSPGICAVAGCDEGFELDDKSKEGYRKIVAFFLVDPMIEVLSTANVPPQRPDWGGEDGDGEGEEVEKSAPKGKAQVVVEEESEEDSEEEESDEESEAE